jgi:hypothetical protein
VPGVALSGNEDAEVKRGTNSVVKLALNGTRSAAIAGIGAEINTAAKQASSRRITSPAVALK